MGINKGINENPLWLALYEKIEKEALKRLEKKGTRADIASDVRKQPRGA